MMEDYLQTEWTDLKVWLTSITEQWAVIAVQGPRAREMLAPLSRISILPPAPSRTWPCARAHLRRGGTSVPRQLHRRARLRGRCRHRLRPCGLGGHLAARRAACDAVAYGTEAMHVLRAEKGYLIVGQDTDGTATPDDVGLAWAVGKDKADFVGKRSPAPARYAQVRPQTDCRPARSRRHGAARGRARSSSSTPTCRPALRRSVM